MVMDIDNVGDLFQEKDEFDQFMSEFHLEAAAPGAVRSVFLVSPFTMKQQG